jgi:hypothetical protein
MTLKTRTKWAAAAAVATVLNVLFAFWLSGFDFDERGVEALGCYLICMVCGGLSFGVVMQLSGTSE